MLMQWWYKELSKFCLNLALATIITYVFKQPSHTYFLIGFVLTGIFILLSWIIAKRGGD
jgi:hypothetical protein